MINGNCSISVTKTILVLHRTRRKLVLLKSLNNPSTRTSFTIPYGDGDSKAFTAVKISYGPEKSVQKFERIGHYQNRVGNRQRKLKRQRNLEEYVDGY